MIALALRVAVAVALVPPVLNASNGSVGCAPFDVPQPKGRTHESAPRQADPIPVASVDALAPLHLPVADTGTCHATGLFQVVDFIPRGLLSNLNGLLLLFIGFALLV